ncbi:hypothetical protein [Kosakonia sp. LAM2021]|uniref:hypothetical protein n=1 Tax=Kosakonia sp. LAM2021 TaxID=2800475 RepID=UPI0019099B5E|nr:hypothetical protein [Kosakonia sp. LAM2021]
MKISKAKVIYDPYEWLPGYGESSVSFHSDGSDIVLEIEYEKEQLEGDKNITNIFRRDIIFKSVRYFMRVPFPGNGGFEYIGVPSQFQLGKLTEFLDSDLIRNNAQEWSRIASHQQPAFRHFSIQFLSVNIAFHVLAISVLVSDEFWVE